MRAAVIAPPRPKTYDYFYDGDVAVEPNDLAVVNSSYGGLVVTVVVAVRDPLVTDRLKDVEGVISTSAKRKAEAAAKQREALRKKLKARMTAATEEKMFEQLAAADSEAKELLAQFKALG